MAVDDTLSAGRRHGAHGQPRDQRHPVGRRWRRLGRGHGPGQPGSVTVGADGTFSYTPNANYNGPDSFTYTITDGMATSRPPPVDQRRARSTMCRWRPTTHPGRRGRHGAHGQPRDQRHPLGRRWQRLGAGHGSVQRHGRWAPTAASTTPNADYNGPDSFTYTITDADGDVSTATATINVAPVNDARWPPTTSVRRGRHAVLTGNLATNDTPVG